LQRCYIDRLNIFIKFIPESVRNEKKQLDPVKIS
jgi:hypothetical protein